MAERLVSLRYPGHAERSRVIIAAGGLGRLQTWLERSRHARALVVSEPRVAALYGARVLGSLARARVDARLVCVPTGERAKSPRHLARLWDECAVAQIGRHDLIVALGGGAVGDVAGFAAATWLRGVDWIDLPTSLLAQVDSSVGGKTAIDIGAGKNLPGAFHQPRLVVADPEVLSTLPKRQLLAGLAEVVKMGVAIDASLFRFVERRADIVRAAEREALTEVVLRSIRAKARIVQADERERDGGSRTSLNLGHTLAHALEACLGYRRLLHGEAVAIGLRVAARLSVEVAGMPQDERRRLDALLDRLGLPARIPGVRLDPLWAAMARDKKGRNDKIRWVLTPRMGHASVPRLVPSRRVEVALLDAGARR